MIATKTIITGTIIIGATTTSMITLKPSMKTIIVTGIVTGIVTVTITGGTEIMTEIGIMTGITTAGGKASVNECGNVSAGSARIAMTATMAARFTTAIPAATLVAPAIRSVAIPAADTAIPARFTGVEDTATAEAAAPTTIKACRTVRIRPERMWPRASRSIQIPGAPTSPTTDIAATWETRTLTGRPTIRAIALAINQTSEAAGAAGGSRNSAWQLAIGTSQRTRPPENMAAFYS